MSPEQQLEHDAGPLEQRLAHALARISLALRYAARRRASTCGLTPTQGEILVWLRSHPDAALHQLAEGLAVTPATASDAVDALEAKGLLRKHKARQGGRALRLRLTARGRRQAEQAAAWPDVVAQAAASLPVAAQRALLTGALAVIKVLQDRGQIPLTRMCVTCVYFRPYVHPDPERPHHCALVNGAFGEDWLRVDCTDHQLDPAPGANWRIWSSYLSEEANP